ncbi:MAG: hypothetical protein M3O68_06800, partial [Thermoproteota archaeon]|nr:hypothetical protein [Thermoproteota archaeon]
RLFTHNGFSAVRVYTNSQKPVLLNPTFPKSGLELMIMIAKSRSYYQVFPKSRLVKPYFPKSRS